MKAWIWLRALAVVLALFAAGHTLGTAVPHVTRGPQETAVFDAMQAFRFPVMGFDRTHWDFYRGFALFISVLFLAMTALAWQVGTLSRRSPRDALPMAVTLQLGCVAMLLLSFLFFFGAPIVMSLAAVVCASVAVALLVKELPGQTSVH